MKSRLFGTAIVLMFSASPVAYGDVFNCMDGDVECLVSAINVSNANGANDRIILAKGGIYTLTTPNPQGGPDGPTGLPSITSRIVLKGQGATIKRSTADGVPDFRILHVASSGNLTLDSVTVRDGRATGGMSPDQDCGGIRLEQNGRLTLNKSVVSDNFSSFLGGGICARPDSTLIIRGSAITDNAATDGGGIFVVKALLDLTDSTISRNSANFGGGVFNDNGSVSSIVNSVISGNTATSWGGGIGNFGFGPGPDAGTRLTISNSVVTDNLGGDGGGIYANIGAAEVTASIISNNSANFGGSAITNANSRSRFSINDSCILENRNTSVFNDTAAPVMDATNNWWGAADGPSGAGFGSGDAVSTNIDFSPFRTSPASACSAGIVAIDIKPGSDRNPVNLKSKGNVPVAILTTDTFDATQVNWETVRFGPSGATERHQRVHVKDADHDGDMDVVLHFRTRDTGILCGDTEAALTGETFSGEQFAGSDVIKIVKCPKRKRR